MKVTYAMIAALIFIMSVFSETKGQEGYKFQEPEAGPRVITAVSPPFIPFVRKKTAYETVTVDVTIDQAGNVVDAQTSKITFFRDRSIEETAKRWKFESSKSPSPRNASIVFAFRIMPKGTPIEDLGTIFTAPYSVEVRHEIFEPTINADPLPKKNR